MEASGRLPAAQPACWGAAVRDTAGFTCTTLKEFGVGVCRHRSGILGTPSVVLCSCRNIGKWDGEEIRGQPLQSFARGCVSRLLEGMSGF